MRPGARRTLISIPPWSPPVIRRQCFSIRLRLFEQAQRYVNLSITSKGPLRDDVTEHRQLMRTALRRDQTKP